MKINKNVIKYCSENDYMDLFHLSSILAELDLMKDQTNELNQYFFTNLLNMNENLDKKDHSISSDSILSDYSNDMIDDEFVKNTSYCETNDANLKNEIVKQLSIIKDQRVNTNVCKEIVKDQSNDEHINSIDTLKYSAYHFCNDLRSLLSEDRNFNCDHKLLNNLCKCLIHYVLKQNKLHDLNKNCTFELLFNIIDRLQIDFNFVFYVVSDFEMGNEFFNYLFELKQSSTNSVVEIYYRLFDQFLKQSVIDELDLSNYYKYSSEQIFELNITFSMGLIKLLIQNRNDYRLVDKYILMLSELVESIKNSKAKIDLVFYEKLRLYNFLIKIFLDTIIEIGAKSVGLLPKNPKTSELTSIFISSFKLQDKNFVKVFKSCHAIIESIFITDLSSKPFELYLNSSERIQLMQENNKELINVWTFLKKFYREFEVCFDAHEYLTTNRTDNTIKSDENYVYNYIKNEKNGYLFLAYAFIESQDTKVVKQLINQLDLNLLVDPRICYIFSECAFIHQETSFYSDMFIKLISRITNPDLLQTYTNLHFKHFGFKKLATIDMNSKHEFFNKADAKCTKALRDELIRSTLVDPLQTIFHVINYCLMSNKNLISFICEMLCKEFYSLCTFKLIKDKYEVNFITSLIHFKMQRLEYDEMESLCYFVKYLAFIANSNNVTELAELEKMILITIQDENLDQSELLKKKVYFVHTMFELNKIFEINFIQIGKLILPFILYILQCLDKFWTDDIQLKIYTLDILNYLKKNYGQKLTEKQAKWIKSKKLKLDNKMVIFYISDMFENELNDLINSDDLNQLLYLCAIDKRFNFSKDFEKHKYENSLTKSTISLIRNFISENLSILTHREHINLFNFLIDYVPMIELFDEYITKGCETQSKHAIEVINQITRTILFKKSKLHDLISTDESKYVAQLEQFYKNLNDVKEQIAKFYDLPKYENFLIEVQKFVHKYKSKLNEKTIQ